MFYNGDKGCTVIYTNMKQQCTFYMYNIKCIPKNTKKQKTIQLPFSRYMYMLDGTTTILYNTPDP